MVDSWLQWLLNILNVICFTIAICIKGEIRTYAIYTILSAFIRTLPYTLEIKKYIRKQLYAEIHPKIRIGEYFLF